MSILKNRRAVVFDLDGTLLDTLPDLAAAVNFALEKSGFPPRSREEIRLFVGDGVRMLVKRAVPEGTAEEEYEKTFSLFREYYLAHMSDLTGPFDGVIETLEALKEKGIRTAVVSNKLDPAVKQLCELYFGRRVDFAFGVNDDSDKKPSPKNVLRALEAMGTGEDDTLYVGDSAVDAKTAENAGLEYVLVTWGYRTREELADCDPVRFIDRPEEMTV